MNEWNNIAYSDTEMEIELQDLIKILWKRKLLIIGIFFIAIVCAYLYVQSVTPIYQTTTTILVQDNERMQSLFTGDAFSMGSSKVDTYNKILKSRNLLHEVIQRLDLRDKNNEVIEPTTLGKMLSVQSVGSTDLIEITIEHTEPLKAQQILNTLVEEFQELNVQMNKSSLSNAIKFVEAQKVSIEKELQDAEERLLEYKESNQIVSPKEEAVNSLETLVKLESSRSMLEIEVESLNKSMDELNDRLIEQPETIVANRVVSNNPLIKQYKGQLTDLEVALVAAESKYTSNHPEVIEIRTKRETLMNSLQKEVERELTSETTSINPIYQTLVQQLLNLEVSYQANMAKIEGYNRLISQYEKELDRLPKKELDLLRLERDAKVTEEIYTLLMTRLEEIKISEAMETSEVFLVDNAYTPIKPIKPNKKTTVILAGIMGIIVGIGLAFLLAYLDRTIKTASEVEKLLNIPVIGSIPDMNKIKKNK